MGGYKHQKSNNNQLSSRASGFLCGRAKSKVANVVSANMAGPLALAASTVANTVINTDTVCCSEMRLYFKKHGITKDAVMILVA